MGKKKDDFDEMCIKAIIMKPYACWAIAEHERVQKTLDTFFMGPGGDEQNVPKFNFRKSLAQYFANSFVGRFIGVAMPKTFLTDCGIPELPIMISKRTLTDKIKQHSLDRDCLKNLDSEINSPVLVFKSENVKDAFNIIVSKSNDEGLLCVSIHTNQKADKILINEIASIHGRRLNQLVRWAEDGYLLKSNADKAKKVFSGSQFNSAQSEYFLSLIDELSVSGVLSH